MKVSKGAKIRNRCNQVPHHTQDTNGKVTNSHLDTTNESQEGSPFPAGDHKAHINRRAQRHNKHKTEKNTKDPQKKYRLGTHSWLKRNHRLLNNCSNMLHNVYNSRCENTGNSCVRAIYVKKCYVLVMKYKGSLTLAMGKCLWFSVKIKVCQSSLSSP